LLAWQQHEETKRALAEVKSLADERTTNLNQAAAREEALKQERATQHEQLQKLQEREAETRERESRRKKRVEQIAERVASYAFIIAWIVFAILGILSFLTRSLWFAVPSAVVGVLNIAAGFSGNTIRCWVRAQVERRLSMLIE